ncbi:MFS transporter [Streptomyces sp. NPDC047967]|uniref:MFS transporter n=1 Tax=Streptomyces sp. NPDC047967 TaxID=3154924 RepID=UPI00340214CF
MPTDSPAPADSPRTPSAPAAQAPAPFPERAPLPDPGPGPTLRDPGAPAAVARPPVPPQPQPHAPALLPAPAPAPAAAPGPGTPAPGTPAPGPGTPAPVTRRGYRAVFAVAEFRAVFAAHLLSLLGVVVSELALTVLVYDLTGSPLLSALTFALGLLPYIVGGTLLAGVADRYPARRVLVVCDLLCAVCVAVMLVPATPVAGLLALRCLVAAIAPVFTGTRMAALTDILGEGDLYVLGRSLLRIVSQSAMLIGFGAGGLLLTVLSPRGAITVTVATFLCSAALLRFGTRDRPARATRGDGGGTLLAESLSGARLILGDRRVRALMLLFWVPPTFVVAPEALAAPYADAIGAPPAALGLLLCAMAVGHIGAELFVGSALSPRNRSRIVLPVAAAGLLPLLVYAVRPGLALALAALALAGAGAAYVIGLDQWFVDAVPRELRGRAMTLLTAGLMTVQGLGMALAGLAAEFFPVHQVVAGSGIVGTVCTLLLVAEARRTDPRRRSCTEGRDGADRHVTSR